MTPFIEALRLAQSSRAKVMLASFADAQEQPPICLTVLAISQDGKTFEIEHENLDRRTYRTFNALWVDGGNGRIENTAGVLKLAEYQERRREREALQSSLRDFSTLAPATTNIKVLQEVPGTLMGRPVSYHLVQAKYKPVTALVSARASHVSRVAYIIDSYESLWNSIDILLSGEFLWPIWVRKFEEQLSPHQDAPDFQAAFTWAQKTPGDMVKLFFTKGWKNNRLFEPSPNQLDKRSVSALLAGKLAIPAKDVPLKTLLEVLPVNELKKPMKVRGI